MAVIPIYPIIRWCSLSLFGLLILILLSPILIVFFTLSFILSSTVSILIRIKYGNKVTRAAGCDAVFGKKISTSVPYINILTRLHGKPHIEEIRRLFTKDIIEARTQNGGRPYAKFTQLFDKRFGYYIWKDYKNFDIKDHIKLIELSDVVDEETIPRATDDVRPQSTNSNDPWQQQSYVMTQESDDDVVQLKSGRRVRWESLVNRVMALYGSRPMVKQLPQWEILVINQNDESFMLLFRVHHSVSDGINLSRFVLEALLNTNIKVPVGTKKTPPFVRLMSWIFSITLLPYELVTLFMVRRNKNPLHGVPLTGKKIYLVSKVYSLDRLRDLKKKAATSVNNILLSCISHALTLHFERRSTAVKNICVLTPVPKQNMAKPMILGNQFNLLKFKLPTAIRNEKTLYATFGHKLDHSLDCHQTPELRRLQIVKKYLDEAYSNVGLISLNGLGRTFSYMLPARLSEALFCTEGFTLFLSNVPGPQVELRYWNGVQRDLIFWVPDRTPMGVGVSIMTYNGRLRMCLIVDQALMDEEKEAPQFMDDFEWALSRLQEEVWQSVTSFDDIV